MKPKGHFEINWPLEQFFLTVGQNNLGNKISLATFRLNNEYKFADPLKQKRILIVTQENDFESQNFDSTSEQFW